MSHLLLAIVLWPLHVLLANATPQWMQIGQGIVTGLLTIGVTVDKLGYYVSKRRGTNMAGKVTRNVEEIAQLRAETQQLHDDLKAHMAREESHEERADQRLDKVERGVARIEGLLEGWNRRPM